MRVLLVEPPISPFDVPTGTFGLPPAYHLERLAGGLVKDHDVRIFDMRIDPSLSEELDDFEPDMVGCSCVAANSHLAKEVLWKAKQQHPGTFTVIGGHHPSLSPESCSENYIDFVVIGEGEATLKDLVQVCSSRKSPATVRGIAWHNGSGILQINPPRPLLDLNMLPIPARHLSKRYRDKKLYYRASWRPTDSIISSRGCPHKCTFCGLWKINHGKYRYRQAELIAEELDTITDPFVCFVDDNTIDHVKNADRLADIIRERGIKKTYELYGRADTIVKHPQLVEKWAEIGMKLLLIGLEATNQEVLDSINKKISTETNQKAIEICHRLGVEIVAYFIVNPNFDREDFKRLSDYVAENQLTHPIFTILSPFPGTQLYEEVKPTLTTDRLDLIDFYHAVIPTRLPSEEFYEEFRNLYKKAYPFTGFVKSVLQKKTVLSPSMFRKTCQFKKRMASLQEHHRTKAPTAPDLY